MTGSPPLPMPSGTGSAASAANSCHWSVSITERRFTGVGSAFGTSMPTTEAPGTTDSNRMFGHFRASAMSFSRFSIVSTLTRCAAVLDCGPPPFQPGFRPYIVTVGPTRIWSTDTSTPCCDSDSSMSSLVASISAAVTPPDGASFRESLGGRCHGKSISAASRRLAASAGSISSSSTSMLISSSEIASESVMDPSPPRSTSARSETPSNAMAESAVSSVADSSANSALISSKLDASSSLSPG